MTATQTAPEPDKSILVACPVMTLVLSHVKNSVVKGKRVMRQSTFTLQHMQCCGV